MPRKSAVASKKTGRRGVTFGEVRAIFLALPGVEQGTSYGTPAFKLKGKFMARLRDDDPDVLVLKPIEDDEQRFLMETQPRAFFKTPHYVGSPTILIRLSHVDRAQLHELVEQCWRRLAPKRLLQQVEASKT